MMAWRCGIMAANHRGARQTTVGRGRREAELQQLHAELERLRARPWWRRLLGQADVGEGGPGRPSPTAAAIAARTPLERLPGAGAGSGAWP